MSRIVSMDRIAANIRANGFPAEVIHSGGGCATIYCGDTIEDKDGTPRYAMLVGCGWFNGDQAYMSTEEAYYGPDDEGESEPYQIPIDMSEPLISARLIGFLKGVTDAAISA